MPEGWRFRRGWFGRMILQYELEEFVPDEGTGELVWKPTGKWADADVMDAVEFAMILEEQRP